MFIVQCHQGDDSILFEPMIQAEDVPVSNEVRYIPSIAQAQAFLTTRSAYIPRFIDIDSHTYQEALPEMPPVGWRIDVVVLESKNVMQYHVMCDYTNRTVYSSNLIASTNEHVGHLLGFFTALGLRDKHNLPISIAVDSSFVLKWYTETNLREHPILQRETDPLVLRLLDRAAQVSAEREPLPLIRGISRSRVVPITSNVTKVNILSVVQAGIDAIHAEQQSRKPTALVTSESASREASIPPMPEPLSAEPKDSMPPEDYLEMLVPQEMSEYEEAVATEKRMATMQVEPLNQEPATPKQIGFMYALAKKTGYVVVLPRKSIYKHHVGRLIGYFQGAKQYQEEVTDWIKRG